MTANLLHEQLTEQVIAAFYEVYNTLGFGFLEKVHENAMAVALRKRGIKVEQQKPIDVLFEGEVVGQYFADLCVGEKIIIEIKTAEAIIDAHKAQLLNYLTATDMQLGLIFNFGPKPSFARKIMSKR